MKNGRMQVKDIPDDAVISAIRRTRIHLSALDAEGRKPEIKVWRMWMWTELKEAGVHRWERVYGTYLRGYPLTPPKLFYRKLQSMYRRGLVHGCLGHSYPGCTDRILHVTEDCKAVWLHDTYQKVKEGKIYLDDYERTRARVESGEQWVCGWDW